MPTSPEEEEYWLRSNGYLVPGTDTKSLWDKCIQITPRGLGFVRSSPNRRALLYILLSHMQEGIWYDTNSVPTIPGMGNNAEHVMNTASAGKFIEIRTKEQING